MKKRLVACLMGMTMLLAAGCGADGSADDTEAVLPEDTEQTGAGAAEDDWVPAAAAFDLDGKEYVTLCDYSAIPVTITGSYTADDAAVEDYMQQIMGYYGPFYVTDDSKTVIGDGDIVNVDYVGKLDGVAFDNGSAEQQIIDVDNNSSVGMYASGYIAGFTDGLKGAKVGDVVDCPVTFPQEYTNEDLAGKDVVFTFTVNAVMKEVADPGELWSDAERKLYPTDTFLALFQTDTAGEVRSALQEILEMNLEQQRLNDIFAGVQEYLLENCTIDIPEDYLEARVSDYRHRYIEAYCAGDESQLGAYLQEYQGNTEEEMMELWRDAVSQTVSLELVMDAISQEMGIEIDEDEYAQYVAQAVQEEGCQSEDELYSLYGAGDTAYGERYFREIYRYNRGLDRLIENAAVTEEQAEDGTESVEETETE